MKTLHTYVEDFFELLKSSEGTEANSNFISALKMALLAFLDNETKENASAVYELFFSTYRIVLEKLETAPFLDLLDMLSAYEERAATLIDKQREPLRPLSQCFQFWGYAFMRKTTNFRNAFNKTNIDREKYPENYPNEHEEFLFRWGVARALP